MSEASRENASQNDCLSWMSWPEDFWEGSLIDEITALTEEKLAGLMKGCWLNEQMTVVLWRDFTHSTYL